MGIVRTIMSGTATVHIDDSAYAKASAGEIERRWEEIDRIIWRINANLNRQDAGEGDGTCRPSS